MPDNRELVIGDKVKNEHGRVMVVTQVYPATYRSRYTCSWVAADGTTRHDLFSREQLEHLEQAQ